MRQATARLANARGSTGPEWTRRLGAPCGLPRPLPAGQSRGAALASGEQPWPLSFSRGASRPQRPAQQAPAHRHGTDGTRTAPLLIASTRRRPAAAAAAAESGSGVRRSFGQLHGQEPRRARRQATTPAASGGADAADEDSPLERRFLRALLLAYCASQNRSLFAAKCLVETVLQMYREGLTVDDVSVALSLAALQQGGALLDPGDQDCLLSWVAVILLALEMVGVSLLPQGEERRRRRAEEAGPAEDTSSMGQGLKGYVRIAVDQFLSGTDLYRLQLQQSMAGDQAGEGDAAGVSPAIRMLQQNTRLVIIALEVVRDSGLPTAVSLQQAPAPAGAAEDAEGEQASSAAASGSTGGSDEQAEAGGGGAGRQASTVPGFLVAFDPDRLAECEGQECRQRAVAVRLLISFMGAAMGRLFSAWDFLDQCTACYSAGWAADSVYERLRDEEFAQSGGMPGLSVAFQPNVSALVFARWLSLTYMTQTTLGQPFPGASERAGWAWVGGSAEAPEGSEAESSTLEAYGLADFVVRTIRLEEEREQERGAAAGGAGAGAGDGSSSAGGEPVVEGLLLHPPLDWGPHEGFVRLEDPRLLSTSPTALLMSQQISLVQMTRQLVQQQQRAAAAAAAAQPA